MPDTFREEISEDRGASWNYGDKRMAKTPDAGDVIFFFYCPTGQKEPGIYGWADVEGCDVARGKLAFKPKSPTDRLKMRPWWDENVKRIVDAIRRGYPRGTLWPVEDSKLVRKIQDGILKHGR